MSTEVYPPGIPSIDLSQRWHTGEYKMQSLAKTPGTVLNGARFFRPFLTLQHQDFVPGLRYMFLGTLDEQGRPWASMLTGDLGFMQSSDPKVLEIQTKAAIVPSYNGTAQGGEKKVNVVRDPVLHNFVSGERFSQNKTYWSGVALDFSNRRRNKMNGVLYPDNVLKLDPETGDLHVRLTVEQTIGNCPKYITIREIKPRSNQEDKKRENGIQQGQQQQTPVIKEYQRVADLGSSAPHQPSSGSRGSTILSDYEQDIIRQADCVFLATRYIDESLPAQTSGMDCNHRGGNPGFVRIQGNTVLIPDYSGNRFFQSLGNIVNDPRVGLLFIDFAAGDTLHLTGRATVLLDEEAQALYPRVQRVVVVEIDDTLLQKGALPFTLQTKEFSPYNPKVPHHKSYMGGREGEQGVGDKAAVNKARLIRADRLSRDVASFHFATTHPINYSPGQYAVLDFGAFNTVGYQHMNNGNPQSVNDDYIRTWTISSAPKSKQGSNNRDNTKMSTWEPTSEFTVTIKRKPEGAISTLLHGLIEYMEDGVGTLDLDQPSTGASRRRPLLEIPFMAADGEFVLPLPTSSLTDSAGVSLLSNTTPREEEGAEQQERQQQETGETETKKESLFAATATSQPRFGATSTLPSSTSPSPDATDGFHPALFGLPIPADVGGDAVADGGSSPLPLSPIRLVLLAGGIGVTPFLSMISGIQEILLASAISGRDPAQVPNKSSNDNNSNNNNNNSGLSYEVDLLVSGSVYEDTLPSVLEALVKRTASIPEGWRNKLTLRISALVSDPSTIPVSALSSAVKVVGGRLTKTRLAELVPDLKDWSTAVSSSPSVVSVAPASSPQKQQLQQQEQQNHPRYRQTNVFLCGPTLYMEAAKNFLQELHVPAAYIHSEEFNY